MFHKMNITRLFELIYCHSSVLHGCICSQRAELSDERSRLSGLSPEGLFEMKGGGPARLVISTAVRRSGLQAASSRLEIRGAEAVQRPSSVRSMGTPQLSHSAV